jgi:electron transfer flavoprotein alpha subunit
MADTILFLAHTEADGTLPKAAYEALTAAKNLARDLKGATLAAGLIGADVAAAANTLTGIERVLGVSGAEFAVSRYASDVAAAAALVSTSGATIVVAPATPRFCRALPGAAARLDGRIETQVTALGVENAAEGDAVQAERWFYRQRMVATLSRSQRPWFLLTSAGAFEPAAFEPATAEPASTEPASARSGKAKLEAVAVDLPVGELRTRVAGIEAAAAEAQTIRPDAEVLLVAGAGWTKKQKDGAPHVKDASRLVLGFLELARASLGSTKSLVDQSSEGAEVMSFMSHLNQVGQTGSTPRHRKGLATCCHGEEPHVVGWRFISERRAINLDETCGWAQGKADVLYVADAFEVMAKVNELLAADA